MDGFPHGYEFYDHNKGPARGKIRHDVYLFGRWLLHPGASVLY
jgi:Transcription-silencing protein, cryptic loci regulator Clr2